MSEVLKSVKSYCGKVRGNFCKHRLKPPRHFEQRNQGHRKYKTVRSKANLGIEALMKEGVQVLAEGLIANAMSLEMALHAWRR